MAKMTQLQLHWSADKVRALRKSFGETQNEFSERVGVDPGTIRHWEQGRGAPSQTACLLLERLQSDLKQEQLAS